MHSNRTAVNAASDRRAFGRAPYFVTFSVISTQITRPVIGSVATMGRSEIRPPPHFIFSPRPHSGAPIPAESTSPPSQWAPGSLFVVWMPSRATPFVHSAVTGVEQRSFRLWLHANFFFLAGTTGFIRRFFVVYLSKQGRQTGIPFGSVSPY